MPESKVKYFNLERFVSVSVNLKFVLIDKDWAIEVK